jgi:hypothetical protein
MRRDLASGYSELAKVFEQLATDKHASVDQQQTNWRAAKGSYEKSLNIWTEMKSHGTLSGADYGRLDEVAKEIAKCESALNSIEGTKTSP